MNCAEAGCTGEIEDGYCNNCGAPAVSATPAQAPAGCTQPDCGGEIEDGYCNNCGAPRAASAVRTAAHTGARTGGSSRLSSAPIGSARAGTSRPTKRLSTASTRRQQLGAGVTSVPSAPVPDPRTVIMANPEVSEDKRFCAKCNAQVGRSRDGKPGRTHGFCAKCRTEFSFEPKLNPGDLVGGQYEVVGALAHGGLGWVYLAADRNVSDRWVVLKGLLNTGDIDAYQAAVAERQFLAEVQHPLIVNIYNFAMHESAGYIVMEYVGGLSLKQLLQARMEVNAGRYEPFPAAQAIAYMIEILPAFGYLHSQGLIYCDFKPDNMIQAGDTVKLIDLGGVRRTDDDESAIYGTIGFQAPEVAALGPSVASDIYTIGRTLALLIMEFRGYQSTYVKSLPPVEDVALFQRYESLYRVLAKATAEHPDDRFQSADDLRDQLLAVLREIVASDGPAAPARQSTPSALFDAPTASDATLEWHELPSLLIDPSDPAAAWLASVSIDDATQRLAVLEGAPQETVEVRLARGRAAIDAGRFDLAERAIENILQDDPWEWRGVWLSGVAALARGDHSAATAAFNTVLGQVPGELAPKLALALACETSGERRVARDLYRTCTIVDANYLAPAAFGLARAALADDDIDGALAALDMIGPTSSGYVTARRSRAEVLAGSDKGLPALAEAAATVDVLPIDPRERQKLVVTVLTRAIDHVRQAGPNPQIQIAGIPATEHDLRNGADHAYRRLAALTSDPKERIGLVDAANAVRPRTLR